MILKTIIIIIDQIKDYLTEIEGGITLFKRHTAVAS